MTSSEIREKFIKFFVSYGHRAIPSASLIPENDPTVLFTTAGMQPLVPYLMGEKHPDGVRLADVQKCVRTDDIDEVGDEVHHTFFEMLGNWSLGYRDNIQYPNKVGVGSSDPTHPYWKEEAIRFSFEFLTSKDWMGVPLEKLAVTCFAGDDDAVRDTEAEQAWLELGMPKERIAFLTKKHNWWPTGGKLPGPQGPDTEMFFWSGEGDAPEKFDPEDNKWVEIWNDVFMQYNKVGEKFHDLPQKNVDTGMGLERMTAVMSGVDDNYLTDLFIPIINKIEELGTKKYDDPSNPLGAGDKKSFRIIADHLRAATFIIGDDNGVTPSNTLQGYILRRLIRRAVQYGKKLGLIESFTSRIGEVVIDKYGDIYPELVRNKEKILSELDQEEIKFEKTLERGLKEFEQIVGNRHACSASERNSHGCSLRGEDAFLLFQSYGFPIEMTAELAKEKGIEVDMKGFDAEFKKHQELSRTASAGVFKGGLADTSKETARLHTAAHLLLASLRQALGEEYGEINQKGSNITAERLRFDFNYPQKLTEEQLQRVEDMVNDKITAKIPVEMMELSLEDAKNIGATGAFESKYGNRVKVYKINDFSMEICGGPHATNTEELGHFKIAKEESSSSGVRRIKAILAKKP